jgi:hypothetical protein
MMGHTKAFATYRDLSQAHINFVVLACYAVPALRPEFSNLSTPLLHQPDHFKFNPESKRELAKYANSYQEVLARTTVMATFSYFESYVREAMSDVIQFHGGVEAFQKLAHDRAAKFIKRLQPDLEKSKRKLQCARQSTCDQIKPAVCL